MVDKRNYKVKGKKLLPKPINRIRRYIKPYNLRRAGIGG